MKINRRVFQAIILLLLLAWAVLEFTRAPQQRRTGCSFPNRDQVASLIYSNHAQCRMRCRDVSAHWVEKVYREGEINCNKSNYTDENRRYALELEDNRGDRLRVIVADDDGEHVIVTVIRLGKKDRCQCS